jgi:hypothetical protein
VAPFRFSAPETRRNGAQIKDKLFKKAKTTKVIVFHFGEVEKDDNKPLRSKRYWKTR